MIAHGTASENCLADIDVFVIAGGLGTRIAPVLGNLPKLMAPISGRPYLAHLLDWLSGFGARRIVLGLGHMAGAVTDFIDSQNSVRGNLTIESVIEPRPLGTAGAIRFARGRLRTDPVLVMNGDSYVDADICQFVAFHRQAKTTATLLCADVDDAGRYGRIELDGEGRIRGFAEKDPHFHGGGPVSAGMYLLSAEFLDGIEAGQASSLERDVFARAASGSLAAFSGPFPFIDIGTPESLVLAGQFFGDRKQAEPI